MIFCFLVFMENEKEIKLNQEKSLEEVMQEKNLNLTPEGVSEKVTLIKEIYGYKSNEAAEEHLKQSILKGKDIDNEISKNKDIVKNNYDINNLTNLESLMKKEKESFNTLMNPFIGKNGLIPEKNLIESLRLGWYRFMSMGKKYERLYNQLEKRTKVDYFLSKKEYLESKKQEVQNLAGLYERKEKENRDDFKYYFKKIREISETLEERVKTKKRLEYERDELEKTLESQESDKLYEEIEDHYYQISEDVENIEEESINLYEISNDDSITLVEKKRESHVNKELKKFYKSIDRKYGRYIKVTNDLIEKINSGMSYEKAYDIAKAFYKSEGTFDDYMKLKKEMIENTDLTIDLRTSNIKEPFININNEKKKKESLYLDNASEKLNNFLKKVRKL